MTLTKKTIFIVSAVIGSVILLVYFLLPALFENDLRELATVNQEFLTKQTMEQINTVLYERYLNIQVLADDEELEGYVSEEAHRREVIEGASIATSTQSSSVFSYSAQHARKELQEHMHVFGVWDTLQVFLNDETVVISTHEEDEGELLSTFLPNTQEVMQEVGKGDVYYSDLVFVGNEKKPTLLFAAPVRDESIIGHPMVGGVIAYFSWPVIEEILEGLPLKAYLFDKNGEMIASNNTNEVALTDGHPLVIKQKEHESGSMVTNDFQTDTELSFVYILQPNVLQYYGNEWFLVTAETSERAFSLARSVTNKTTVLLFIVGILSVTSLAFALQKFILKRILQLSKITVEAQHGNFQRRVHMPGNDEISTLSENLNTMLEVVTKEAKVRQHLLDLLPSVICIVDGTGKIQQTNVNIKNILGYTRKEIVNKDIGILFPNDEDVSKVLAAITGKESEEMFDYLVGMYSKKEDETIPMHVYIHNSVSLPEGGGHALLVALDRRSEMDLENKKREIISIASHQMRTPLTSMRGNLENFSDGIYGEISEEQRLALNDMTESTIRLIAMVGELLNVSRLEQESLELKIETIEVNKKIQKVLSDLNEYIESKNAEVTVDIPDISMCALGDKVHIRQVLQNIIDNAIKYGGNPPKVAIHVSVVGSYVQVKIVDNGIGIPEKEQKDVFTKFYRASNAQRVTNTGTGLGLYFAKKVIEKHSGTFEFVSEQNKGTTITFTLPKAEC